MELVYLWVEDYKNIHHQGFNFSPRFKCHYDEATNELIIDENKEYVSIFPDNINITAIVGKNGAGKSTIQKLIFLLIFLKKYENFEAENPIDKEKEEAIIEIFKNEFYTNKNIFLILNTTQGFKKISLLQTIQNYSNPVIEPFKSNSKECPLNEKYTELQPNEIDFFSIHFHYMIDTWFDGYHTADDWTLNLYHRVDGFETPLLLEPYKGHKKDTQYINISNIEYLNNQHMFDFYGQLTEKLKFNEFFNPNYIWMMIDGEKIKRKFENFNGFPKDDLHEVFKIIDEYIDQCVKNKKLLELNTLYVISKIINTDNETLFNDDFKPRKLRDEIINLDKDKLEQYIQNFNLHTILIKPGLNETKKLEACIEFDKMIVDGAKLQQYKEFLVLDPSNRDTKTLKEVRDLFNYLLPWVQVEFYDEDKGYSSLSSGEKAFLNFAMNLLYQVGNIKRNGTYKTMNLFLDEVEYSLHPEWQREFVNQVLILLKNFNDMQFNLFFVTHSPFILSDLPKENVIFLEDGKQKDVDINTFGANIHTLLSHGFFMRDGLMGEFAKEKIDKVITLLNKPRRLSKSSMQFCENIISIVGEPILKRQLQKMLDSKRLHKMDEIDRLKADISELHQKIKKLENKR